MAACSHGPAPMRAGFGAAGRIEAVTAPRRPGLLTDLGAAALTLVLVAIAGWLGCWQYDAWQASRDAEARDLTELAPVPLTDVMGSDDPFPGQDLGRPVEVAASGWTAASGSRTASSGTATASGPSRRSRSATPPCSSYAAGRRSPTPTCSPRAARRT